MLANTKRQLRRCTLADFARNVSDGFALLRLERESRAVAVLRCHGVTQSSLQMIAAVPSTRLGFLLNGRFLTAIARLHWFGWIGFLEYKHTLHCLNLLRIVASTTSPSTLPHRAVTFHHSNRF